jgi:hypothetical protein
VTNSTLLFLRHDRATNAIEAAALNRGESGSKGGRVGSPDLVTVSREASGESSQAPSSSTSPTQGALNRGSSKGSSRATSPEHRRFPPTISPSPGLGLGQASALINGHKDGISPMAASGQAGGVSQPQPQPPHHKKLSFLSLGR